MGEEEEYHLNRESFFGFLRFVLFTGGKGREGKGWVLSFLAAALGLGWVGLDRDGVGWSWALPGQRHGHGRRGFALLCFVHAAHGRRPVTTTII